MEHCVGIAFAEHPEKLDKKAYVEATERFQSCYLLLLPSIQVSHQLSQSTEAWTHPRPRDLGVVGDFSGYVERVKEYESKRLLALPLTVQSWANDFPGLRGLVCKMKSLN